jgi:hypothetical protein
LRGTAPPSRYIITEKSVIDAHYTKNKPLCKIR